jgi:hypothetical protein
MPIQLFGVLRAVLVITFCVSGYVSLRAETPPPTLKPFGEFAWGDGIPSALEKLSHIRSLERLSTFLGDHESKVNPPTNSADVAAIIHAIPASLDSSDSNSGTGRSNWIDIRLGRKDTERLVTVLAKIIASPVLIDGIPFTVTCEFQPHPAVILRNPDQVFKDPVNKVIFAYTLVAVNVASTSNQLPEHLHSLNKTLVDKYGHYYYPFGSAAAGGQAEFEADLMPTGFGRVDTDQTEITIEAKRSYYTINYRARDWLPPLDEIYRKHLAEMEKDAVKPAEDMKKDL